MVIITLSNQHNDMIVDKYDIIINYFLKNNVRALFFMILSSINVI